jgi:hypothetical protein
VGYITIQLYYKNREKVLELNKNSEYGEEYKITLYKMKWELLFGWSLDKKIAC